MGLADSPFDQHPARRWTPRGGCFRFRDLVSGLVDGTLDDDAADAMRRHLVTCQECAEEVSLERQVRSRMRLEATAAPAPSLSLSDRLVSIGGDAGATVWLSGSATELPSPRRERRRRFTAASGSAAAVCLVLLVIGWCFAPDLPMTDATAVASRGASELGAYSDELAAAPDVVPTPVSHGRVASSAHQSAEGDCPSPYTCPAELAGYSLTSVRDEGTALVLCYGTAVASGVAASYSLVVVEQRGRLGEAEAAATSSGVVSSLPSGVLAAVWQNESVVFAAVSNDELVLKTAASVLPHQPYSKPGIWQRVHSGWQRLAGR